MTTGLPDPDTEVGAPVAHRLLEEPAPGWLGSLHPTDDHGCAREARFVMLPTPSISTVTVSPSCRNSCGLRRKPTPDGVPVRMTSPAASSVNSDTVAISRGC